jgi:hypothetical protein
MDIQIHRLLLEHSAQALPDDPQNIEAHIAECNRMVAFWEDILAQRVLILLGFPRCLVRFTTREGARDADLSALDREMSQHLLC